MNASPNNIRSSTLGRRTFLGLCTGLPAALSCVTGDQSFDEPLDQLRSVSFVNVFEPEPGQDLSEAQHCSISLDLGDGLSLGDQVRIQRTSTEYALYTVVEIREELEPMTVRMNVEGLERLGTDASCTADLDTTVTRSELSDAEAKAQSEFVERLVDDGVHTGLVVVAAHAGKIEGYTDQQAERMTANLPGISSWICKGWRSGGGAVDRWHITSTELSPNSFPGLAAIADRGFDYAVSFHGMSAAGILIGGRAPIELREQLRDAIVAAIADPTVEVNVSGDDGPLRGVSSNNFVNWLTYDGESGIQIEQSKVVRQQYWAEIADAITSVLGPLV